MLTYDDLLFEHESHIAYLKRTIKDVEEYNKLVRFAKKLYRSILLYVDFEVPCITNLSEKLKEEYRYKDYDLAGVFNYRNFEIPYYYDDYGQQFTCIFKGKEYGAGAFNFNYLFDFCMFVEELLDYQQIL